jgi:hypothetical protein
MATVTITAANVIPTSTGSRSIVQLGVAVTAGLFLYLKSSDNKWYKADATTAEKAGNSSPNRIKMALSDGAINQYIAAADPASTVDVGSVVSKGRYYVLSATAGKMANEGDLVSTNYVTLMGYALDADTFYFDPQPTGILL